MDQNSYITGQFAKINSMSTKAKVLRCRMHYTGQGLAHNIRGAMSVGGGVACQGGLTSVLTWLMTGRRGGIHWGGEAKKGQFARETAGAATLLRAFVKDSEVKSCGRPIPSVPYLLR